ncbi:MAG: hypothetical protein ACKO3R_09020 [bacterium]
MLNKLLNRPVTSSSETSTGILNTGEVGSGAKLPELQKIEEGSNEIKRTGGFFGKLLAKPKASTTDTDSEETPASESKATANANPELSTKETKSLEEVPKLLSFGELPGNLQKSLKFLSDENKEKIQAVKVESNNPKVENYEIMFTGKAAKQLFLNTFQNILHGMNLFGKSNAPDQAARLLSESDQNRSFLSKALANDSVYLQAQFAVPVNTNEKAEIKNISVTESPFNLQKLLLERKDLKEVVLNAAKQIIKEQPNISIKAELEESIKALEKGDKNALKNAFEPFARTYSLEALKASPEADRLKDTTTALIARGSSREEGPKPTVVIPGLHVEGNDAIFIKDVLLPTKSGKFDSGEITIVNKNDANNLPKLIFYILPTMTNFTQAGKPLNKEASQALTEAMVKSTINADSQAKAAVADLN